MSFYVSTLRNVPEARFNHYIYVVDCSGNSIHTSWINENLDIIGRDIGSGAGIISGPNDLSREVFDFLSIELDEGFCEIEELLHSSTCLIISDNVLGDNYNDVFLIPLSNGEGESDELHDYMNQVLDGIINSISSGDFFSYLDESAAVKFKIKGRRKLLVDSANSIF